jgi:hypothetical protein
MRRPLPIRTPGLSVAIAAKTGFSSTPGPIQRFTMAESGVALKFNSEKVRDERMGDMAGRKVGEEVAWD